MIYSEGGTVACKHQYGNADVVFKRTRRKRMKMDIFRPQERLHHWRELQ